MESLMKIIIVRKMKEENEGVESEDAEINVADL